MISFPAFSRHLKIPTEIPCHICYNLRFLCMSSWCSPPFMESIYHDGTGYVKHWYKERFRSLYIPPFWAGVGEKSCSLVRLGNSVENPKGAGCPGALGTYRASYLAFSQSYSAMASTLLIMAIMHSTMEFPLSEPKCRSSG